MNHRVTELSKCHNAPVVLCEGAAWDVPKESIRDGSTYYYGCTECHEACDLSQSVTDLPETFSAKDINVPSKQAVAEIEVKNGLELCLTNIKLTGSTVRGKRTGNILSTEDIGKILALVDREVSKARINELGGVQLEYGGRFGATTYINGTAQSIEDRITALKQQLGKEEG